MVKCGFDLFQDFVIIWLHSRVLPPAADVDDDDEWRRWNDCDYVDDGIDANADALDISPDDVDNDNGNDNDDYNDDDVDDDDDDGIDANADTLDISAVPSRKPCGGKSWESW